MSERFVIHTFQKKVQFSNLNFFNSKTTLALELGMDEKARKTMRKEKKEKKMCTVKMLILQTHYFS